MPARNPAYETDADSLAATRRAEALCSFEQCRLLPDGVAFAYRPSGHVARAWSKWAQLHPTCQVVMDAHRDGRLWVEVSGPSGTQRVLTELIVKNRGYRRPSAVSRLGCWLDRATCRATAWHRALPDFLILGAPKCGTSSLFADLAKHPNVHPAKFKEAFFFDHGWHQGLGRYRAKFPLQRTMTQYRQAGAVALTGEASPSYLASPHAPRRVSTVCPNAKLVVVLRDPVERAHSEWSQTFRRGIETLSFADAIESEEERIAPGWARMTSDERYFSPEYWHFAYVARSRYADQLDRWLQWFPREQLHVIISEEFWRDPVVIFRGLTDFLGLPPWSPPSYVKTNSFRRESIDPQVRCRLQGMLQPHNARLSEWLGRPLPWDAVALTI